MPRNDEPETVDVVFLHMTDRAVLVAEDKDDEGVWLPLSQVEIDPTDPERGDLIELTGPQWLLEDRGLV